MTTPLHTYKVSGYGRFPIDMLRYETPTEPDTSVSLVPVVFTASVSPDIVQFPLHPHQLELPE